MRRLIDADALKHKLKQLAFDYFNEGMSFMVTEAVDNCIDITDGMPTIDPVRHGRCIKNKDRSGWHCSCCSKDNLYAYPYAENNERELQDFYCPNCGAKMDEGGEKNG